MGTVRQPLATQAELDTESGLRASGDSALADLLAAEVAARAAADDLRALLTDPRFTDARPPTGGAGGVLSGGYPDPGFAVDMAEQSELQTEITNRAADVDAEEAARIAADAAHAALTNNPHAVTKAQVGLGNVTNDAQETSAGAQSKVDAAIAALLDSAPGALDTLNELAAALGDDPNFATTLTDALALKAPIASPTFTGAVTLPGDPGAALVAAPKQYVDAQAAAAQAASQPTDTDLGVIAALTPTNDDLMQRKAGAWANRTPAQVKTDLVLQNVDNTSDVNKPVSTAQQTALNTKAGISVNQGGLFVATDGNDANDGLSWGAAKATLAAAIGPDREVFIGPGVFAYTVAQVYTDVANLVLWGSGPATLLKKTGAGHLLTLGAQAAEKRNLIVGNLSLATEAGAGDALRLERVHSSRIGPLWIPSSAGAGVRSLGSILNAFPGVDVSTNLPYSGTRANPTAGVVLDYGSGMPGGSNANTFTHSVFEGINGPGIDLVDADANVFLGGTSEGNVYGVRWGTGVHDNALIGVYMELNSGGHENGTRGDNALLSNVGLGTSIPFSSGTVAQPSMTFLGDSDSGFYRIAANRIGLALGGVLVMDFLSNQIKLMNVDWLPGTNGNTDMGSNALRWRAMYLNAWLEVGGSKVVGARGAAVANAAGGTIVDIEARAALNALLARLRTTGGHGLIAD